MFYLITVLQPLNEHFHSARSDAVAIEPQRFYEPENRLKSPHLFVFQHVAQVQFLNLKKILNTMRVLTAIVEPCAAIYPILSCFGMLISTRTRHTYLNSQERCIISEAFLTTCGIIWLFTFQLLLKSIEESFLAVLLNLLTVGLFVIFTFEAIFMISSTICSFNSTLSKYKIVFCKNNV